MKNVGSDMFALPKVAPRRTAVPDNVAEAFVQAERPASIVAAALGNDTEAPPTNRPAPNVNSARLSVDVPSQVLRKLKIRAIERGQTVREYVLALLEADGLTE